MNKEYLTIEEIREKAKAEAYGKARAESEVQQMSEIAQDPTKSLQTKLNVKVAEQIDSSEVVKKKIEETAAKLVDTGLKSQQNKAKTYETKSETEILAAEFEKYEDEFAYHGIKGKVDKAWKKKLIFVINDIWFVIFAILSLFTIVPISIFLSRLSAMKGFVKSVAIILGIILLLIVLCSITYAIVKYIVAL